MQLPIWSLLTKCSLLISRAIAFLRSKRIKSKQTRYETKSQLSFDSINLQNEQQQLRHFIDCCWTVVPPFTATNAHKLYYLDFPNFNLFKPNVYLLMPNVWRFYGWLKRQNESFRFDSIWHCNVNHIDLSIVSWWPGPWYNNGNA